LKAPFVHGTQRELGKRGKVAHDFQVLNGPGLTHNNLDDDCPRGCGLFGVLRMSDGNDAWGDVTLILSIRASLRKKGVKAGPAAKYARGRKTTATLRTDGSGFPCLEAGVNFQD